MHYMDKANLSVLFYSDKEMKRRALKRISLGTLNVTSGEIVACDPIVQPDREPFARRVAPGRYEVEYLEGDSRPALLVLWLRERKTIDPAGLTWEMALMAGDDVSRLDDDEYFGYPVDAGWGCLMDADAARAMAEREERAKAEDPDFDNYYEEFLSDETEDSNAFEHCPSGEQDGCNIMLCTSGWGDGSYPSYWALDKQGEPVALVTDFMVIKNGDARDEDDIADEAYLASLSPEKLAALEALEAAVAAGDVDAVKKLCAAGLVSANEIIPSSGGTAIYEAIRLDQQEVLTALLAGAPCPEMPARLNSGDKTDYFSYANSMRKLYLKKRKPRSPESSDILLQSVGLAEKPTKSAAFASGVELLSSAAITLVPVGELLTRYSLFRLNEYSSCRDEDPQPLIAVCEANLKLADLDLDYPEDFSGEEPVGFLIVGDLTVTGNISNEDTDGARSLVVLGDLHAGNIAVGGQELYVRGNVVVDGVYCGYYNHGESFVDGDVAARLLIADDYSFHIGGETHAPLADREGGDIPIHFVLAEECLDDDEWPFNFYVLLERLRDGLPVLHPDCFEGSPKLAAWRKAFSRYKQALSYYEDDEPQKAIPLLTWCIDNNIHLGECLAKRASSQMIRLDQDDEADAEAAYAAARADCERVIEAKGFGSEKWLAEALNIFGYTLYHADSYEEALEPLTRSLEIDSGQFNANSNLGKCLWHLDRCDEALPYLDKAIGIDSDADYPHLVKAHCHYELEDYEAAAATFADYVERDPESEGAREQLIRSLIALDRLTDAQAQAFELFEQHPNHKLVNADGFMADALLDAGRSEDALKHALLSVKADPKPGYHFYVKGLCHDFMKDRNNARTAWQAYAEVAPNDLLVLNRLAISFMTKDPKAALRYIDRALAIDPEDESSLMTREMIELMQPD